MELRLLVLPSSAKIKIQMSNGSLLAEVYVYDVIKRKDYDCVYVGQTCAHKTRIKDKQKPWPHWTKTPLSTFHFFLPVGAWVKFCWVCAAGLSKRHPILGCSVANYRLQIHLSPFLANTNFRDPNFVTFYLWMYLILNKEHFTFHLQYIHSGTFANLPPTAPPNPILRYNI